MYCSRCGARVSDDAAFCSACGAPLTHIYAVQNAVREERYEGVVHKCPNCGQALDSFDAMCPLCGYELRGSRSVSSLTDLFAALQDSNEGHEDERKRGFLQRLKNSSASSNDQGALLIRAFPIPNTKEDLIEFIIVSAANVNADAFNEMKKNNLSPSDIAMSNAWLSKLEQAYQKAAIVLGKDASFTNLKNLYDGTMKKVTSAKRAMARFWIVWSAAMAGIIAFCLLMAAINPDS